MKKIILFALISLLLIPNLVNAFWYKDFEVEKEISESLVAGSTDSIIVSFKNSMPFMGSLIAKLNVTEVTGENPVWLSDFKVKAVLNSTSLYPGYASSISEMICREKTNGTFYCFNLTDITEEECFPFFKKLICWIEGNPESHIVLPKSINNLTFYVTFNLALIPSDYDFGVGIYKGFGVPRVEDPLQKMIRAEEPTLFNSDSDTELLVTTNEDKSLSVYIILYEFVIAEEFAPPGLIPIKFVGIEANDTISAANIGIYYNESEIPEYVDENSLKLYYYNPEGWEWELIENSGVNLTGKYVFGTVDHLSLFGIFGSPSREIVHVPGATTYLPGGVVYRNVTQNVTVEKEKIINRTIEVPAEAVCGNGYCESGETCSNCPEDCICPVGQECIDDVCVEIMPAAVPTGISGMFIAIAENPVYIVLLALLVIAMILIIFRVIKLRKK